MTSKVHWGSFCDSADRQFVGDASLPTSVAPGYQGPVKKTRVATYFGNAWSAEREEGGDLVIYHLGTGVGLPVDVAGGSTGDASPGMSASKLQAINEAWRARNAPVKRVRAAGR